MNNPPINEILTKTGNLYVLVVQTAKRARQLTEGHECTVACETNKPIAMAINEIHQGKVGFRSTHELK